jgi:hypothetical protein
VTAISVSEYGKNPPLPPRFENYSLISSDDTPVGIFIAFRFYFKISNTEVKSGKIEGLFRERACSAENRNNKFYSTFSLCNPILSTNVTNKMHKFVNYKYIYY